jgi:paraquat-inducible protein A
MHLPLRESLFDLLLWCLACGLLAAGAVLPMFSFHKFYIFDDTFSLLSGVLFLLREGEYFLFVLLAGFSLAIPGYKLVTAAILLLGRVEAERRKRLVMRLARLDKWSMADVFVIAVIAATVKLGDLVRIEVHAGLYVFACGVIASLWLVHRQLAHYELVPRPPAAPR